MEIEKKGVKHAFLLGSLSLITLKLDHIHLRVGTMTSTPPPPPLPSSSDFPKKSTKSSLTTRSNLASSGEMLGSLPGNDSIKNLRWSKWTIFLVLALAFIELLPSLIYYARPMQAPVTKEQIKTDLQMGLERTLEAEKEDLLWIKALAKESGITIEELTVDPKQKQLLHLRCATTQETKQLALLVQYASKLRLGPSSTIKALKASDQEEDPLSLKEGSFTLARPLSLDPLSSAADTFSFEAIMPASREEQAKAHYKRLEKILTEDPAYSGLSPKLELLFFSHQLYREQLEGRESLLEGARELTKWERLLQTEQSRALFYKLISKHLGSEEAKKGTKALFEEEILALEKRLQEQEERETKPSELNTKEHQEQLATLQELQKGLKALETLLEPLSEQASSSATQEKMVHPLFSSLTLTPPHNKSHQGDHFLLELRTLETQNLPEELALFYRQRLLGLLEKLRTQQQLPFRQEAEGEQLYESKVSFAHPQGAFAKMPIATLLQEESLAIEDLLRRAPLQSRELAPKNYPLILSSEKETLDQDLDLGIRLVSNTSSSIGPFIVFEGLQSIASALQARQNRAEVDKFYNDLYRIEELLATRGYQRLDLTPSLIELLWPGKEAWAKAKRALVFGYQQTWAQRLARTRLPWQQTALSFEAAPVEPSLLLEQGLQSARAKMLNKIDDQIHDEHLLNYEQYEKAQNDVRQESSKLYPLLPRQLLLDNFLLTWKKITRGDASKILRWGLDLSGGKTVRVELLNQKGERVQEEEALLQAQNELGQRVNKMGLSEVAIRIEGAYLVLDFPSSQNRRASELIQAAQMRFHLVHETFSPHSLTHGADVRTFLKEVERYVEQKEADRSELSSQGSYSLEQLTSAAAHLLGYGEVKGDPMSPSAKKLREAGLKILPPGSYQAEQSLPSKEAAPLSVVAMMRPSAAEEMSDPSLRQKSLMILFAHHALEGRDLARVEGGYDPEHGNTLRFSVALKDANDPTRSPQEIFWNWTSTFSTEGIRSTSYESATQGRGWRMAVLLNGEIVSAPSLSSALREHAMIHGSFTQREVEHLVSDLRAGALTYVPKILSEENISPELGAQDRQQGLFAALCGLALVIAMMVSYYGRAGMVASLAVLFNLLLTWAILHHLEAAMTLSGIAALVLTVGMSVDANVLIFERMREELERGISFRGALKAGYERAFSAILDSNLTTILAALILIQFDSGPIKGFAITLIVGIASSMFTALFMTKTAFWSWIQAFPSTSLQLKQWIPSKLVFDFFKQRRLITLIWLIATFSGLSLAYQERSVIFGMDFTGGYALEVTLKNLEALGQEPGQAKAKVKEALSQEGGIAPGFIQIRELQGGERLKIELHGAIDEALFRGLDHSTSSQVERIRLLQRALERAEIEITENTEQLEMKWTSVSSQFSGQMRRNALGAIVAALGAILIYVALRFEWRFALSAVAGLGCDLLATIAAIGWARSLGIPVEIDLQAIGAIMTIIGYALNDTIIIFDRIREASGCALGENPRATINQALCETLSRTLMTSGTTLAALLALNLLGGASLLSFSLIMTLGILLGLYCSLFLTSYVLEAIWHRSSKIEG